MNPATDFDLESLHPRRKRPFEKTLDLYFRPTRLERWQNGRVYELLGIRVFKRLVVAIGRSVFGLDGTSGNRYFISDISAKGLRAYERRTRVSEAIHAPITLFLTFGVIYALIEHNYATAAFASGWWLLNALPAALQRYNRVRIESTLLMMMSVRAAQPRSKSASRKASGPLSTR